MRLFKQKVFQGFVVGGAAPVPVYTLPQFDRLMGLASALTIEVTASDVVGSPELLVDFQTSNSGSFWTTLIAKIVDYFPSLSAPVGLGTTTKEGADRVRAAISLSGAGTSANVLITVVGRAQQDWA